MERSEPPPPAPGTTRLVAWNVSRASGSRLQGITEALAELRPSIVVLSEVTHARLHDWTIALGGIGLAPPRATVERCRAEGKYGVLVASTSTPELKSWKRIPSAFATRIIKVEVEGITVVGVLGPSTHRLSPSFYRWFGSKVEPLLDKDAVLIGDFNAGEEHEVRYYKHFESLLAQGWFHTIPPSRNADHWSHRLQNGVVTLDHCLLSRTLHSRHAGSWLVPSVNGVLTAGFAKGIAAGALADHKPIVVDLDLGDRSP